MIPARLSLVTIGTEDLPSLRRFYTGLGWSEVPGSDDNWTAYVLGGVVFSLFPNEFLDSESGPSMGGTESFILGLNVDTREEVDQVFAALVAAGANPVTDPRDASWGGRSAYVSDPEGNRWEIAWAPGAVFGPRGEIVSFGG